MSDDIWLPGFDQVGTGASIGTYEDGHPARFVFHFTQGYLADVGKGAATHPNPPQLWACLPSHPYTPKRRVQTIPLNRPGRALKHEAGDPETNRAHAIQVEIEGFSETSDQLSTEDLDWLADEVVGPACAATGVNVARFLDTVGPEGAGASKPQRLSWAQWSSFDGLCGHQHVPGNDHWDPGRLDIGHISARLSRVVPPISTTKRGKMLDSVLDKAGRATFVRVASGKVQYRFQPAPSSGPLGGWLDMQHPGDDPGAFDNVTIFRNLDGRLEVHAWNSGVPGAPVFAKWQKDGQQDKRPDQSEFTSWAPV